MCEWMPYFPYFIAKPVLQIWGVEFERSKAKDGFELHYLIFLVLVLINPLWDPNLMEVQYSIAGVLL